MLARFSEAFLVLQDLQVDIPLALTPLVMVTMNIIYAASAYPFGKLSDRISHFKLLGVGLIILIIADLILAHSNHWSTLLLGVTLWGIHMGMTQGLLSAMVAENAPADLRGTAYGFFSLINGLALLIASVLAGFIWDQFGATITFLHRRYLLLIGFSRIDLETQSLRHKILRLFLPKAQITTFDDQLLNSCTPFLKCLM
jgi:MFS family permease